LAILSDGALLGTINVTYNTAFEVVLFLTNDGSWPTSTNACPWKERYHWWAGCSLGDSSRTYAI
jgi:hypothetical protein